MGIQSSHGAFTGPHGTFNRLRRLAARCIGVELWAMEGYCGVCRDTWDGRGDPPTSVSRIEARPIPWTLLRNEPLTPLLEMPDGGPDAVIGPSAASALADRLEELRPDFVEQAELMERIPARMVERLDHLILGCRRAAEANENLTF